MYQIPTNISQEFSRLSEIEQKIVENWKEDKYQLEKIFDFAYSYTCSSDEKRVKEWDLCILGIAHGNEVIGLSLITELLELLISRSLRPKVNIVLVLGNVSAAKKGKRFIEHDFNRLYEGDYLEGAEYKRAQKISEVIANSSFMLDFHQTQRPTLRSFFIFPFKEEALHFSWLLDKNNAVITYRNITKTSKGYTASNLASNKGVIGMTVELGERGFFQEQLIRGQFLVLKALMILENFYLEEGNQNKELSFSEYLASKAIYKEEDLKIFTFIGEMKFPEGTNIKFRENLHNFLKLKKGETLGESDGKNLNCPLDGYLLFPKYPSKGKGGEAVQRDLTDPFCKIIKEIEISKL